MKLGWCLHCRSWRVLVRIQTCGCGGKHKQIAEFSNCPAPKVRWAIRSHGCGHRIVPVRTRELEGTAS